VKSVLLTESAVLVHLKPVRIILLVLHRVVVSLFALCAGQCNFNSHDGTSRCTEKYLGLKKTSASLILKGRKKITPL
jgi:hypothetical protein